MDNGMTALLGNKLYMSEGGTDMVSAAKDSYGKYIDTMVEVSIALKTRKPITFEKFPGVGPVSPDDDAFWLYANETLGQFGKELELYVKAEEWEGQISKLVNNLWG